MRTEIPAPPLDRLKALAGRARRRFGRLGAGTRWAAAGAGVALLVAAGYLAGPAEPIGSEWVFGGQPVGDEPAQVARALNPRHLTFIRDERGRVSVPADRVAEAEDALIKARLAPRSPGEILREAIEHNDLLDGLGQHARRVERAREEFLEALIRGLPEAHVRSAYVSVSREDSGGLGRPAKAARALVYLETEGGRPLSPGTLTTLRSMLLGSIPDLKADAVTIISNGQVCLSPDDPEVGRLVQTRARSEALERTLKDQLDWIEGVRIKVTLDPPPPTATTPAPAATPTPAVALPAVGINTPMEAQPGPALAGPEPPSGRANVQVLVPSSFFLREFREVEPGRNPGRDELKAYFRRVEERVRAIIDVAVPPGEQVRTVVDWFPDAGPPRPAPVPVPADPGSRAVAAWWAAAGAIVGVAGAAVTVAATGHRRRSTRRPAPLAEDEPRRAFAVADEPGPARGPSERVRDLVRRNPEVAAGVLQRWVGPGGHAA